MSLGQTTSAPASTCDTAARGWIDERRIVLEILTGIVRAGADFVLTYHAADAARWLREGEPAS